MKKNYTAPDAEIVKYEVEDVLLASVGMLGFFNELLNDESENSLSALQDWL